MSELVIPDDVYVDDGIAKCGYCDTEFTMDDPPHVVTREGWRSNSGTLVDAVDHIWEEPLPWHKGCVAQANEDLRRLRGDSSG